MAMLVPKNFLLISYTDKKSLNRNTLKVVQFRLKVVEVTGLEPYRNRQKRGFFR